MSIEMVAGENYNFSLRAAFNGHVVFKNVSLLGTVGLEVALASGKTNIVTEHERAKYTLPPELQGLVLTDELFYIIKPKNGSARSVIPRSYIDPSSIVQLTTLSKTMKFTLDGVQQLEFLRGLLRDHAIEVEEM